MNPQETEPNQEALLASIESSVTTRYPEFLPDRTRIADTSSGERGILEFFTGEGKDKAVNPVIYVLLKRSGGLTSYAQHIPPPEGKFSLIGGTSYDFGENGKEVPWKESDADLMLDKLKVLTDGIELTDAFLDQVSTYSPKLERFITFRERLSPTDSLEEPQDDYDPIDWNEVDPELKAVYEEEMENILSSSPKRAMTGMRTRELAALHPNLGQLIVEENLKKGVFTPSVGIETAEAAIAEIKTGSPLGQKIVRRELHRLDAIDGIIETRRPKLPFPQSS